MRELLVLLGTLAAILVVGGLVVSASRPDCRPGESLVRSEDDGLVCVASRSP